MCSRGSEFKVQKSTKEKSGVAVAVFALARPRSGAVWPRVLVAVQSRVMKGTFRMNLHITDYLLECICIWLHSPVIINLARNRADVDH
jgi:hypothetical protein